MASSSRGTCLRLPRPKTFLGIMTLQTGTELISLALLFNKLTGLYGLLAILTGFGLSALQLSMYLTSLLALGLLAWCLPHVRRGSPLQNLALAQLYVLDTAVGAVYTGVFAGKWFTAAPAQGGEQKGGEPEPGEWMAPHESAVSLVLVVAFTLLRVYFALVVMAHARAVIQRFVEGPSADEDGGRRGDPFAPGSPSGMGWRGKLGRGLLFVGRGYWLGGVRDEEWTQGAKSKFKKAAPPAEAEAL